MSSRDNKRSKRKIQKLRNMRVETWKTYDLNPRLQIMLDHNKADVMNATEQPLKSLSESCVTLNKLQMNNNYDIASTSKEKEPFYTSTNIYIITTPSTGECPKRSTQEGKEPVKTSVLKKRKLVQDLSNNQSVISLQSPKPKNKENRSYLQGFSTIIKSTSYEKFEEITLHDTAKSFYEVKETVPPKTETKIDNTPANTCRESYVVRFDTFTEVKSNVNSASTQTVSNEQLQQTRDVNSNDKDNHLQSKQSSKKESEPYNIVNEVYKIIRETEKSAQTNSKAENVIKKTHVGVASTDVENKNLCTDDEKIYDFKTKETNAFAYALPFLDSYYMDIKSQKISRDKTNDTQTDTADILALVNPVTAELNKDFEVQADLKLIVEDIGINPIEFHQDTKILLDIVEDNIMANYDDVVEASHTDLEHKKASKDDDLNPTIYIQNELEVATLDIDQEEINNFDQMNDRDHITQNSDLSFTHQFSQDDHQIEAITIDKKETDAIDQTNYNDRITQNYSLNPSQYFQNELQTEILDIDQIEKNYIEDHNMTKDDKDLPKSEGYSTLFNVFHQYIVRPLFERRNKEKSWTDDESLADSVTIRTVSFPLQIERRQGTLRRRDQSRSTIDTERSNDYPLKSTLDVLQNQTISDFFTSNQKTAKEERKIVLEVPKTKKLLSGPDDSWVPEAEGPSKRDLQLEQLKEKVKPKKIIKNNEGTQTLEPKTAPPYEGKQQMEEFEKRTSKDGKAVCYCYEKDFNVVANHTGMFKDGRRRVDMVLVLKNFKQHHHVEFIRLNFLVALVKAGLHIEAENGVFHKDLIFIKLHATDTFLKTYGEAFGVGSPLRRYHSGFDPVDDQELTGNLKYRHEGEMMAAIRSTYKRPLRLSNYQRSYIVKMVLLYLSFGDNKNYYGVERLIDKKIVTDMFALHDGPYERNNKTKFSRAGHFNGRQVLYSMWCGIANIICGQPFYNIYEYFGPKMGFYFTFYEYYNKMLAIASLWGIWMMLMYQTSSGDYMYAVRNYTCSHINLTDSDFLSNYFKTRDNWDYNWHSVICPECEGTSKTAICPYTLVQHYCLDLKIMKVYDSPFITIYSFGISGLVLLFLALWKRIQHFWSWMFEENELGVDKRLIKPSYSIGRRCRSLDCIQILKTWLFDYMVPIFAILFPMLVVFFWFVGDYEGTRALSSKDMNSSLTIGVSPNRTDRSVTPALDRGKEYSVLVSQSFYLHVVFYLIEKLLHFGSYYVTKWENHKTQGSFERCLILCFFWISCHYTFYPTLYHAWLKGAFFHSPISHWDVALNVITPFFNRSYPLTKILSVCWAKTLRIAFSLNCGPFSCLRHGFVVYCVLLLFRVLIVGLLDLLYRFLLTAWNLFKSCRKFKYSTSVPTVEREYLLQTFSERQLVMKYNSLFLQFALVMLFCPLMPLAPLLALLINLWDLRYTAHLFVVHYRRTIFHKSSGIGSWNHILTMLCFALPFFHAITVARTDIFQKYIFNKVFSRNMIPVAIKLGRFPYNGHNVRNPYKWPNEPFIKFMYFSNYIQGNPLKTHAAFTALNQERVDLPRRRGDVRKPQKFNWRFWYFKKNYTYDVISYRCRLHVCLLVWEREKNIEYASCISHWECCKNHLRDPSVSVYCNLGFFQETHLRKGFHYTDEPVSDPTWPYAYNYMEKNYSYFAPAPHHYEWHFYKTFYVLFATLFFALVAFCLYRYMSVIPSKLQRYILREQQLLRLRKMPFGLPQPKQTLTEVETTGFYVNPAEGGQNGVNPTTGVNPTEVKPDMVKFTEESPHEINPNQVKPAVVTPTGVKPNEVKPTAAIPNEDKPGEVYPNEVKPTPAIPNEVKPGEVYPNEVKPTAAIPNEVKPGEVYPNEVKPTAAIPNEDKPGGVNPNEVKPTAAIPNEDKSGEVYPNEVKPTLAIPNQDKTLTPTVANPKEG